MKKELNGAEALQAINQGKVVYYFVRNVYLWREIVHDPIFGQTTIILCHTSGQTSEDIVSNVSLYKHEFSETRGGYIIYDRDEDDGTLSMRDAYKAMEAGEIVYNVNDPEAYYFLLNIDTPFGRIRRVFYQDKDLDHKEPVNSLWNATSNGIDRYRIYKQTKIEDIH